MFPRIKSGKLEMVDDSTKEVQASMDADGPAAAAVGSSACEEGDSSGGNCGGGGGGDGGDGGGGEVIPKAKGRVSLPKPPAPELIQVGWFVGWFVGAGWGQNCLGSGVRVV